MVMKPDRAEGNRVTLRPRLTWLMILVLAVAFFLRVYDVGNTPLGVHYDEAANAILTDEIAHGAWPIFIEGYTGKEVLYFYLASLMVRLIGTPLIAIRLTSAFIGTVSVAVTYRMTREMFREHLGEGSGRAGDIALIAAALHATNLWAVTTSRLGFRAPTQPLLQSLTILFLWRALQHSRWAGNSPSRPLTPGDRLQPAEAPSFRAVFDRWQPTLDWVLAGLFCGLSAHTYLAIRAFPLLLAPFLLWVLIAVPGSSARIRRGQRIKTIRHIGLFLLVAALVFSPLGLFYLQNPQYFANRISQVSVLSSQAGSNHWATLWHAIKVSFGVFIQRGDLNWRFNVSGAPALWWPVAAFFVAGLLIGLWHLIKPIARSQPPSATAEVEEIGDRARKAEHSQATEHSRAAGHSRALAIAETTASLQWGAILLLLLWLPIMLLPSILGGQDVEISLSLRAIGVLPAIYIWSALGMVEIATWLRHGVRPAFHTFYYALIGIVLLTNSIYVFIQCFTVWGPSTGNYYAASGYLVDAANYLNATLPGDARCYVAAEHYRHPTLALLADGYTRFKWLIGPDVFVFPATSDQETWIVWTYEAMPSEDMLLRLFGSSGQTYPAPDGQVAFRVFRYAPGQNPSPQPDVPARANLGNTLRFIGYDVNTPAVSGQAFDVTLYFQIQQAVDRDDYAFFVHLVDDAGLQWGGDTFFTYPSAQWAAGETLIVRFTSPIWAGAPPGEYALTIGAYSPSLDARLPLLNERGQMSGTTIKVAPLDVARAAVPPDDLPPIANRIDARLGETVTLLGSDRLPGTLRPGETLNLSLYWQKTGPASASQQDPCARCTVALRLEQTERQAGKTPEGQSASRIQLWNGHPVRGNYPFSQWQPGEFVRDRYALRLPIDIHAGTFALNLQVIGSDDDRAITLGIITVESSERMWEPPPFDHIVGAQLSDKVLLLGYSLDRQQVTPGETLHLTLIWQTVAEMDTAYTVFTHLLDENEQIRGQKDNPPQKGTYPTTLWAAGEVVVDEYEIVVQDGSLPGTHAIEVGMYDPTNMQRLPVYDPTGKIASEPAGEIAGEIGDRILLGEITITGD